MEDPFMSYPITEFPAASILSCPNLWLFPIALSLSESPYPSSPLRHRLLPYLASSASKMPASITVGMERSVKRGKKVEAKFHNSSHCLPCSTQSFPTLSGALRISCQFGPIFSFVISSFQYLTLARFLACLSSPSGPFWSLHK